MSKPKVHRKPKGLPTPKETPPGLPSVRSASQEEVAGLDTNIRNARICPGCGREGRAVSNRLGVNVHCGPCKRHWPITNSALRPETSEALPRGFSKQTRVEPNWSIAFDDIQSPDGG